MMIPAQNHATFGGGHPYKLRGLFALKLAILFKRLALNFFDPT
jgi:hypothetical protein